MDSPNQEQRGVTKGAQRESKRRKEVVCSYNEIMTQIIACMDCDKLHF